MTRQKRPTVQCPEGQRPKVPDEPQSQSELLRACLADLADSPPGSPEQLNRLLERALAFFAADSGQLWLLEADGELALAAARPTSLGPCAAEAQLRAQALERGEALCARELAGAEESEPEASCRLKSCMAAPLRHAGRCLGVLQVGDSARAHAYGAGHLECLAAVAACVASAASTSRVTSRESEPRDSLTGLSNHARFWSRLEVEFQRAERHRRSVGLVMVDVDDFKAYNDRLGHKSGDDALARVARILESGSRAHDLVARYGGEEFAVLLPETDVTGALCYAEKLRRTVETACFGPKGAESLTVSIGLASSEGEVASPRELVALAEECLDRAKQQGRNQVCSGLD